MKTSAQILLLLALFSLLSLTLSTKVTVTKSFSTSKSYHSSGKGGGNSGSDGSDNEEEAEAPPINPGADNFHACDPNNRPEVCTLEYAPVCGYIHECEGGSCTSTFGNDCSACGNSNVDGYVNGACEDVQTTCDPDNRPEVCPDIYTATCAVAANCEGSHYFQDTSSSCVACGAEGVAYSLPGVCPGNDDDDSDRNYCDANNRPEVCTEEYNPVCAHRSNCVGDDCWSTAGNACSACGNENVDYWEPGECSDDDEEEEDDDGRTYCDADNRPEICTLEYNPVCAHTSGCTGDNCWNTAGNACGACSDPNVDYHVPGECPNDDNDDDDGDGDNGGDDDGDDGDDNGRTECDVNNRPEICTLEYAPVCAHIIECEGDGDECFRTEGNGCGACSLDDVDYYTQGEC